MGIDEALEHVRQSQQQLEAVATDDTGALPAGNRQAVLSAERARRDRAIVAAARAGADEETIARAAGCTQASVRWAIENAAQEEYQAQDPATA